MTDTQAIADFKTTVWNYYHDFGRHDLPWRESECDPYKIMVSEIMLQQTQVRRVIIKYQEFLMKFPDVTSLASAQLSEVLIAWSGLGYNRRAKFLHQAAQMVVHDFDRAFPRTVAGMTRLPGIGVNTAGAIMAYSFNEPVVFVETNIRTVIIHHFFADQVGVSDAAILEITAQVLDHDNPREWYWALMDYGSHLKQSVGNVSRQSKIYTKQSKFEGSKRQVRGQVIRILSGSALSLEQLAKEIKDERLEAVVEDLLQEGLIRKDGASLTL